MQLNTITVAIPTYNREQVLINTVQHVLAQGRPADEILVVDQTPEHEASVARQLSRWHTDGSIRWLKQKEANLSAARNRALLEATSDIVIFLDDDVVLSQNFIRAHEESFTDGRAKLVAGQIVSIDRPVHTGEIDDFELGFPLSHDRSAWIKNMGGGGILACIVSLPLRWADLISGFTAWRTEKTAIFYFAFVCTIAA